MLNSYKYSTLFVLLIIFLNADAQKKKTSTGYIITKNNDTVACDFGSHNWKKQPAQLKIKIDGKDTIIRPEEISGFTNSLGNKFVSRKIELFKYNREIQTAIAGDVPEIEIVPAAFLKILYQGKINLYLYKDALNSDHFFIEKNSMLKEIYIHLYSSTGGYSTSTLNAFAKKPVVVNNFQYYYGLKEMMQDCKDIFPEVDKTELNTKSLISLLKQYEECKVVNDN